MMKYFDGDMNMIHQRMTKPMIEKRRRARINHCLMQLKEMVIDSGHQKIEKPKCKYEKADILELTVNYLKQTNINGDGIRSSSACSFSSPSSPPSSPSSSLPSDDHQVILSKTEQSFAQGFTECAKQIQDFVDSQMEEQMSSEVLMPKLMSHLQQFLHQHIMSTSNPDLRSISPSCDQENMSQDRRVIRHTSECARISTPSSRSSTSSSSNSSSSNYPLSPDFSISSGQSEDAPLNLAIYGKIKDEHCMEMMDMNMESEGDFVWRPW